MSEVASSLSVNLNQILQKKVQVLDLQYDYYCKYLVAGCRSQNGPEILLLEKDGSSDDSGSLRLVNSITARADPVFLSWAPPKFGRTLVVVLSDNSVCFYRQPSAGSGCQLSLVREVSEVQKSISCMSVGVSPIGELLCAVGSPGGGVSVIFGEGSFETTQFQGHYGGVNSVSFAIGEGSVDNSSAGMPCLLATGGMDGCVKIWELVDRKFQLLKTLTLEHDSKSLTHVKCLCWNKSGLRLAVATGSDVFVFGRVADWSESQRVRLPHSYAQVSLSFNNDRLLVSCDGESFVYRPEENGAYVLSNTLEGSKE
ncbi:COPII-coated vesicle component Sec13 [Babesia ovis]|uniref:COPII-coated vesicle component Sec13 n=1 Tax=Babesia ovis TaxID=5869 RepID=A0A9W5TC75_BABOV|nr:COPII-coated vesicle component Sec13 [Babesia ovis]GFE53004.1 COPII-coated vesicle component Sec13 [Babesia ovis]